MAAAAAAAIFREAANYERAFHTEPVNLPRLPFDSAGQDMTGFTFQPTRAHLIAAGLSRRDQAQTMPWRQPTREISVFPFVVFLAAVLFTTNVWIATHLRVEPERALLFAASGAAGVPIFQWSPVACSRTARGASSARLDRAEMLSLLAGD